MAKDVAGTLCLQGQWAIARGPRTSPGEGHLHGGLPGPSLVLAWRVVRPTDLAELDRDVSQGPNVPKHAQTEPEKFSQI